MSSIRVLEKSATYGENIINQDGLWKKVIGELFEDFLLFFAPELYQEIDFSKVPDFLQQELFKEIIKDKKGTKYADQIVKVHLKSGEEQWVLVHIEVQGSADDDFPERMFRYFYRIFDKFDREIVAFAVMTGPENKNESNRFSYSYFGTKLEYAYNVCKIMDYDDEELAQSERLFSKIVLAAKYMHETKNDTDKRFQFKTKLMREIIKMDNHPRKSIQAVFYFIDYLLRLPKELTKQLVETIQPILQEEGNIMVQYENQDLSPTLAQLMANERRAGEEKGIEQGIEQGLEKGKTEERRNFALMLLREDFSDDYIAKLTTLGVEEVRKLREEL